MKILKLEFEYKGKRYKRRTEVSGTCSNCAFDTTEGCIMPEEVGTILPYCEDGIYVKIKKRGKK